jgi:hypothetical protein
MVLINRFPRQRALAQSVFCFRQETGTYSDLQQGTFMLRARIPPGSAKGAKA